MVLEAYLYGDPAETLDRKRAQHKREVERKRRDRAHKAKRIQALVRAKLTGRGK